MLYCKSHENKAYTETEFDSIITCDHSGAYQEGEGLIRVYCFLPLDQALAKRRGIDLDISMVCPLQTVKET